MPFNENVNTTCDFHTLDEQISKKINEVAEDAGRNSHGRVKLANGTICDHWRAGDYRFFGTYADKTLTVIGWGQHAGRGNSTYKVNLCAGNTTRAETS